MNWWRAHHGLPFDPKLAVVARRSEAGRAEVLAVWIVCLDRASQHESRGSVEGIDPEEIGIGLDLEREKVVRILGTFREKGMIDANDRIVAWERRQPLREREDNSTERVRQFRQRHSGNETETPCNATQHQETHGNAQIRGDRGDRSEKKTPICASTSDAPMADLSARPQKTRPIREMTPQQRGWFNEWWGIYWRHKGKKKAEGAFRVQVQTEERFRVVMTATRAQWSEMAGRKAEHRPYGATWLNGECWQDEKDTGIPARPILRYEVPK